MKVSLVITIFNEESSIDYLLDAIQKQTTAPDEIIFVDGGSTDTSIKILSKWKEKPFFKKRLQILEKKGNRSIGRKFAIKNAKHPWIAITDAGCIPDKNWLKELIKEQKKSNTVVIAGYYFGIPKTAFEEAVIPYVLVMPDKINPINFLPATRSMMIKKETWKKLGGFDKKLNHNEDYAFAKKIESENIPRSFTKKAQVGWFPRKNLFSFINMIFRFAYGDAEADILRPKVIFLLTRYLIASIGLFLYYLYFISNKFSEIISNNIFLKNWGILFFIAIFIFYLLWAVLKNKKYVKNGWYWLPILQLSADAAVITGTISGMLKINKQIT